jgi:lysozyme family protein
MVDLAALKEANAKRWETAKMTRNFLSVAQALVRNDAKPRYLAVSKATGVPWYFIAVVHERESSQSWKASLAQGDPWNEVSHHVPAGHGPFGSWEDAAIDALVSCSPFAARNKDWSVGGLLTMLEEYNGLGYFEGPVTRRNGIIVARYPSQASPYIWAGTNQYFSGKYTADGVFSPTAVDSQLGCAGLILGMMRLDRTITFGAPRAVPSPPVATAPSVAKPAKGSIGAAIAALISALASIFKRNKSP